MLDGGSVCCSMWYNVENILAMVDSLPTNIVLVGFGQYNSPHPTKVNVGLHTSHYFGCYNLGIEFRYRNYKYTNAPSLRRLNSNFI